jgi:hypothetical protein
MLRLGVGGKRLSQTCMVVSRYRNRLFRPLCTHLSFTSSNVFSSQLFPLPNTPTYYARVVDPSHDPSHVTNKLLAPPVSKWRRLIRGFLRVIRLFLLSTPVIWGGVVLYVFPVWCVGLKEPLWKYARWAVESAGPTFIKFCQWAGTRTDLFPEDLVWRFKLLQDQTTPHSWAHTDKVLVEGLVSQDTLLSDLLF